MGKNQDWSNPLSDNKLFVVEEFYSNRVNAQKNMSDIEKACWVSIWGRLNAIANAASAQIFKETINIQIARLGGDEEEESLILAAFNDAFDELVIALLECHQYIDFDIIQTLFEITKDSEEVLPNPIITNKLIKIIEAHESADIMPTLSYRLFKNELIQCLDGNVSWKSPLDTEKEKEVGNSRTSSTAGFFPVIPEITEKQRAKMNQLSRRLAKALTFDKKNVTAKRNEWGDIMISVRMAQKNLVETIGLCVDFEKFETDSVDTILKDLLKRSSCPSLADMSEKDGKEKKFSL